MTVFSLLPPPRWQRENNLALEGKTMIARIKAFLLGAMEFRLTVTTSFSDLDHQDAYDWGREVAHRCTLRRLEPH